MINKITILQSAITVSGKLIIVVQCNDKSLPIDSILSSPEGLRWRITSVDPLRNIKDMGNLFVYYIEAIDHGSRPITNSELTVVSVVV